MAKRRHVGEAELPFVALMDTMTNVVGVLTIVLVMIGISLASAVRKVLSDLPPATPQQVEAAQSKLDAARAALKAPEVALKALEQAKADPAAIAAELARLEKQAKEKGVRLPDADALAKERAKREEELAAKKAEAAKRAEELARLRAALSAIPVPKPVEGKVIRVPDSRPIPDGATVERFMVTGDAIYYVDAEGATRAVARELESSFARALELRRVKDGNKTRPIFDQDKLVAHFARRKLQHREFSLEVPYSKPYTRPRVKMVPRPGTGEPLAKALQFNSIYQSTLRGIKARPKSVVLFMVMADGFEAYLGARDVCDRMGVPAGWELARELAHVAVVQGVEMNALEKPPAPAPGTKTVAPPKSKLD
jgi:hypothetical protein